MSTECNLKSQNSECSVGHVKECLAQGISKKVSYNVNTEWEQRELSWIKNTKTVEGARMLTNLKPWHGV